MVTLTFHRPLRGHQLGECRVMVTLVCHRPLRGCLVAECMLVVTLVCHRPLTGHPLGQCRLVVTLVCHRPLRGCLLCECRLVVTVVCYRPLRGCLLCECSWRLAMGTQGRSQRKQRPLVMPRASRGVTAGERSQDGNPDPQCRHSGPQGRPTLHAVQWVHQPSHQSLAEHPPSKWSQTFIFQVTRDD